MEVVKLPVADEAREDIIHYLENLLASVRGGDVETIFIIAIANGGRRYYTGEKGKKIHRLETIGYLETLKLDLINAQSVTDKPDGAA